MLKLMPAITVAVFSIIISGAISYGSPACRGRILNVVTDICWGCFFPIKIGTTGGDSLEFKGGADPDNDDAMPPAICTCALPPPLPPRVGITFSMWDPARLAEVVREPMCFPTLGGANAMPSGMMMPKGTNNAQGGGAKTAFYHVHYFKYPIVNMLGIFKDVACLHNETPDLAYVTEFDVLWDDDQLALLLSVEAILFSNPAAVLACVADAVKVSATNFGFDPLFWCSGTQGMVYPLSGTTDSHVGAVDTSLLLIHRHLFKMHRLGLAHDTSILLQNPYTCSPVPTMMMKKTMYKQNMVYPMPQPVRGFGLGYPSAVWSAGKEFPYKGEDFGYLMWRKVLCCI